MKKILFLLVISYITMQAVPYNVIISVYDGAQTWQRVVALNNRVKAFVEFDQVLGYGFRGDVLSVDNENITLQLKLFVHKTNKPAVMFFCMKNKIYWNNNPIQAHSGNRHIKIDAQKCIL